MQKVPKAKVKKCYRLTKTGKASTPVAEKDLPRKCDSKQKLKTKSVKKPKKIIKKPEVPRKCCGCPINENDSQIDYDDCESHSSDTQIKTFYINSDSSLVSITDVDNFVDGTMTKKMSCPCGSKTFLLKDLATCDCRFQGATKRPNSCPSINHIRSDASVSLQVSESIVEPLVRSAKTQTSFILNDDEFPSIREEPDGHLGCEENCPDFEPRPILGEEEEDESDLKCQDQEYNISPKPSNDYFIFWDRTILSPKNICPPKPKYKPEIKKTPKPEPNLDYMNECELMDYYKSQIPQKVKKIRTKKRIDDSQMLQNWCPQAFKLPVPEPRARKKKKSNNKLKNPMDTNCLLDPLFNLRVLIDPKVKVEACYKRCLLPQDCVGYPMRPEVTAGEEHSCMQQLDLRRTTNS